MNNRVVQVLIHILAWGLFFSLLFSLIARPPAMPLFLFILVPNILFIAFYYYNFYVLIPQIFLPEKYALYALITLTGLSVTLCITSVATYRYLPGSLLPEVLSTVNISGENISSLPPPPRFVRIINPASSYSIFAFAFITLLSLVIRLIMQWQTLEKERANAELVFLKGQINPHFMFNALNNIYSLAVNNSPKTAETISRFTTIIRYVCSETRHDFVPLEKSLEYLNDFVSLQVMRLPESVVVDYHVTGNPEKKRIAPMLLMPFIENAFKYGVSTERHSRISINIAIVGKELQMTVINTRFPELNLYPDSSHLGIENTRKRLGLIYPGKHLLNISENNNEFHLSLYLVLI